MTRAAFDGPIRWSHCRINGKMTSSCDVGNHRLYVCERFGAIEAWVDQAKLGNFATMGQAKAACLKRLGLPVPGGGPELKARPKLQPPQSKPMPWPKPPRQSYEPRVAKGARFGEPKNRRAEEDAKLATFPVADLSQPPVITAMTMPAPPAKTTIIVHGHCKCGAKLGRSGKCPALCEPVPQSPPVYTGPKVVGARTHIGRMCQPVTGWIG